MANPLEKIAVSRALVDELCRARCISPEAREYALGLIFNDEGWAVWVSRLLLAVGLTLILSGIIYFFAFNWAVMPSLVKLLLIQLVLVASLAVAYWQTLNRLTGQLALLFACVLTGVFLAVFGQIYQTGADTYRLFMTWSVLMLGWTLISKFAPLWAVWLGVTHVFFVLWWAQYVSPDPELQFLICVPLLAVNGGLLALREHLAGASQNGWLLHQWIRLGLVVLTLIPVCLPMIVLVTTQYWTNYYLLALTLIGVVGHAAMYAVYRYRLKDISSLALVIFSLCIVAEATSFTLLHEYLNKHEPIMFLSMGLVTLSIVTAAIRLLYRISDSIESGCL